MSNAFAVSEVVSTPEAVPAPTLHVVTITITVTDQDPNHFTVSSPYFPIAKDSANFITWELIAPPSYRFDTPGILFIGDQPNIARLNNNESNRRSVVWVNNQATSGRSFPYRVMLLRALDGSTTSITDDPIVHNDPPSLE
jgi:hypothetical protein